MGCLLLNYIIGTNINHIPFRGTGQRCGASRPASISCARSSPPPSRRSKPQRQGAGDLRHQAFAGAARPADCSGAGHRQAVAYTWNAIFLPKGAPAAIVNKLNAAAQAAVKTASTRSTSGLGAEIASGDQMTPPIPRPAREKRNREMGGTDQGERHFCRLSIPDRAAEFYRASNTRAKISSTCFK